MRSYPLTVYAQLDRISSALQRPLGPRFAAVLVGAFGVGVACLVVRLGTEPVELGRFYAWLSLDPGSIRKGNPVSFRPLTPLASYAIGLRGVNLMFTNLFLAALFLAGVYDWFRRHAPRPGDALLASAAFAFSLVTLSTVFAPHYCDSTTYLVAFGMWCLREQRLAFYALFALGLLNHESLVFLAPWFAFLELSASRNRLRTLATQAVGFGAGVALLLALRAWIGRQGPVAFGLDYYLVPLAEDPLHFFRQSARFQWAGFTSVFGAAWAIPVAGAVSMWRRGERRGPLGLVLLGLVTWSQLLLATDTSRLFTLSFLAMLIALDELFRHGQLGFRSWGPWLVLLQALSPHFQVAGKHVWLMDSLWTSQVWGK
jgi:hypothetical protein